MHVGVHQSCGERLEHRVEQEGRKVDDVRPLKTQFRDAVVEDLDRHKVVTAGIRVYAKHPSQSTTAVASTVVALAARAQTVGRRSARRLLRLRRF